MCRRARRRRQLAWCSLLGWVLLTPPYGEPPMSATMGIGCGDPGHVNECAPLSWWRRLGAFSDAEACGRARETGIAAARSDDERAGWELARCFSAERVLRGPGLLPGE